MCLCTAISPDQTIICRIGRRSRGSLFLQLQFVGLRLRVMLATWTAWCVSVPTDTGARFTLPPKPDHVRRKKMLGIVVAFMSFMSFVSDDAEGHRSLSISMVYARALCAYSSRVVTLSELSRKHDALQSQTKRPQSSTSSLTGTNETLHFPPCGNAVGAVETGKL